MAHGRHDHGNDHHHGHGRGHAVSVGYGRLFAIGIALNLGFVVIEAWFGWKTGSLALLADAAHNLGDVGGLVLAWAAWAAARLPANEHKTYGWQRGSILAGFINAVVLLVAMGSLGWEAVGRLQEPSPVAAGTVMVVAAVGVVINTATALLFMRGSDRDLNIRGAFLHMAADALVSLGVIVAAALYLWQGWTWIDPLASLVIVLVVIAGTWSLFRQSLHLLFDGVPEHIDLQQVRSTLAALPGVTAVHDLHVWAMGTAEPALTAHLVCREDAAAGDVLREARLQLQRRYAIDHVTLQIEHEPCASHCDDPGGAPHVHP
jgi:cobalt-zinc-cadmium efflux system protein